jgi:hypothetical protein
MQHNTERTANVQQKRDRLSDGIGSSTLKVVRAATEVTRRHGMRAAPKLSMVLVAADDAAITDDLHDTLAAYDRAGVELLLVQRGGAASVPGFRRLRHARAVTGSATATPGELRAAGMAAASGDIVTVCVLPARGNEAGFESLRAIATPPRARH